MMKIEMAALVNILLLMVLMMNFVSGIDMQMLDNLRKRYGKATIERTCFHQHTFTDRPRFDTSKRLTVDELEMCLRKTKFEHMTPQQIDAERFRRISESVSCDAMGSCFFRGPQATLMFGMGMNVCRDCLDSLEAGAWMDTWDAHYGPIGFQISGPVIIGVPNDASIALINHKQLKGAIVVLFREKKVGLVDMVKRAQDAEAIGVVIIDRTGDCTEDFQCGRLLGDRPVDKVSIGFAARDVMNLWRDIYIPSVIITKTSGERLLATMDLQLVRLGILDEEHYVPKM